MRRTGALLLGLLHLGAIGTVAADAVLEAESAGATIHVESPGTTDCEAHHDHLFCQVVRSLGAASASAARATTEAADLQLFVALPPESDAFSPSALPPGSFGPRGPPSV